jgi:CRISPR-associated protein Cmr6
MIGCHWQFIDKSAVYYFPVRNIENITKIIDSVKTSVNNWLIFKGKTPKDQISSWRESFHPEKVQVWGRIAENEDDSLAIEWFHGNYNETQSIKGSQLTGRMGNIGRVYHRMYPHHIKTSEGEIKRRGREYIELLTIFPDRSTSTQEFLAFLPNSGFTKVWGV